MNRIFNLNSVCSDINLSNYNINDVDILITIKDNVLLGFLSKKIDKSTYALVNTVKISNDFILSMREKHLYNKNLTFIRPSIINNLLNSSNIKCILTLKRKAKDELIKRFNCEFKDKIFNNIFVLSNLRKEEFLRLPIEEHNKLFKINIEDDSSIGEYIYNSCKNTTLKPIQNSIIKILNETRDNFSQNIMNIDCLYLQISSFAEQQIINYLNSSIPDSTFEDSTLKLIDLIVLKDKINDNLSYQRLVQSKIDKLNAIFVEIDNTIRRVYNPSLYKTFSISCGKIPDGLRCCYYSLAKKSLRVKGHEYKVNCISFSNLNNFRLNLDNPLYIKNTLSLNISYRKKVIYSISEEHQNKLLEAQKEILSIVDLDNDYKFID